MGDSDSLPAGEQRVCPRCGALAQDGIWCDDCGLNLGQQGELPTADAYAAKVRERRWLEERAREARQEREAQAARKAAERERRPKEAEEARRADAVGRQAERERRVAEKREPSRSGRRRWLVATAIAGLVIVGGAGALALVGGSGMTDTQTEVRSSEDGKGGGERPRPGNLDEGDDAATPRQCGTTEGSITVVVERGSVSCEEARDVMSNFTRGESTDGGVTVIYEGWKCGGASAIGCRKPGAGEISGAFPSKEGSTETVAEFEECGALSGPAANNLFDVEASGIDCVGAFEFIEEWQAAAAKYPNPCSNPDGPPDNPCELIGWTCTSTKTGVESSAHECVRDGMTVRYTTGA